MAWPTTFQRLVAPFDPFNAHYLRDAGAFSLGLGITLILGLTIERRALSVALLATGVASVAHSASHIVDHAAGGRPVFDIPSLGLLGLVLLAEGWTINPQRRTRLESEPPSSRSSAARTRQS